MDAWDKNFECWHQNNTSVGIFCELCGCNKPLERHETYCPNEPDRSYKDDNDFWYGLGTGPDQFWYDEEADVCDACADEEDDIAEWLEETDDDWTMRDKCLGNYSDDYPQFPTAGMFLGAEPNQSNYTTGHPPLSGIPGIPGVMYTSGPLKPASRNPAFEAILASMSAIHDRKNRDYAEEGNPYSNFEFAAKIGGCSVDTVFRTLIGVKLARLDELLKGKSAQFESITDSQLDLAVYAALWASYGRR